MSSLPHYVVLIDHSRSPQARSAAAEMQTAIAAITDVSTAIYLDERDWWSKDSVVVSPAVSYSPFGDSDGSKRAS